MVLALGTGNNVSARGRDLLARFEGGIGVDPVASVAGQNTNGVFSGVTQNVVRGVTPAPGAWRIADLKAEIDSDGVINVRGRGLVLAGGDRIGQSLQLRVGATLICEAARPFVERSTTTLVELDGNGDFRMHDTVSPVPSECASPVLLIRSGGNGGWLAAGIVRVDE